MSELLGDDRDRMARAIRQRLESLQRAGVTHLPKGRAAVSAARPTAAATRLPTDEVPVTVLEPPHKTAVRNAATTAAKLSRPAVVPPKSPLPVDAPTTVALASTEQHTAALEVIRQEVTSCVRCSVLASTRTQTVFGVGNPSAKICFFGEAPGADEDRLGEPFVGRAGQLLTKMIQACGLKREDVYILNVLKCRPPDNRNPLPDEVANCRTFFERQFDVVRPEMICCLGAVASQALLQTDRSIGKLRKSFHNFRGIPVLCTYHPAYLLRNPAAKGDAWEDLKLMMGRLGVQL
ncbi:MAG: uracil-DNA glycosylase [Pirellulales bacterium]|nr:uracil-DNA glycosylase [Pirellulales bacterium]